MSPGPWLPFAELRGRLRTHPLRLSEVPVEHEVSFPLPTTRFGRPAYACFAGACVRRPDGPAEYAPPDRWWAVDAATGRLTAAIRVPVPPRSLADQRAAVARLEAAISDSAPAFFAGERMDTAELRDALTTVLPAEMLPVYRTLAADFFAWLGE